MKTTFFSLVFLFVAQISLGQNIRDNKVDFNYIQLPKILIDKSFNQYEVRVNHNYLDANEDSLALYAVKQDAAKKEYEANIARYYSTKDSLERLYLVQLSAWEKQLNAGATNGQGQPIVQPTAPIFPEPPVLRRIEEPRLHTKLDEETVSNGVQIQGYEQGIGGSILNISIDPLRVLRIVEKKKGTGASTKYTYTCEFSLPVQIKLETPTQGVLIDQLIQGANQTYKMKEFSSKYDYQLYMMDHANEFYSELERYARQRAISSASSYLNEQVGFMNKTRRTEIYSVRKFKSYDYTDVTNAYTATVQALALVGKDRDCSSAQDGLEKALALWNEIMIESNTYDGKARINDKISAMIQCNIAEIQMWQADFSSSEATLNLAINAGVLKAKNHANSAQSFLQYRKERWNANY